MKAEFSPGLLAAIREVAGRYPKPQAALLPVLHLVQKEFGHIPPEGERTVAGLLGVNPIRVREATTFYSMFRRRPMGRYHLQVCVNLTCTLLESRTLLGYLQDGLGLRPGDTTPDGLFSLSTVECLGACEQAPCLMVNEELIGNLDRGKLEALLNRLRTDHD